LHQLCLHSPTVSDKLFELHSNHEKKGTRLSLGEYSTFLQIVASGFSKVYMIVDGLDECPHRGVDEVGDKFLDKIKALPLKAQLLVTSRDLPEIALKFATDSRLEIQASKKAIESYLEARIDSSDNLKRHVRKKPSLRKAIVETVTRKAEGI
jgi:hypothetical protein